MSLISLNETRILFCLWSSLEKVPKMNMLKERKKKKKNINMHAATYADSYTFTPTHAHRCLFVVLSFM